MKYAGIGSRKTPDHVLSIMRAIGVSLASLGFILRSGRARGADQAFEIGARHGAGICEIYEPRHDLPLKWFQHAAMYHPAWNKCSADAKILHARNSPIMLGPELIDPVKFVCCYTVDGQATGGTGQAIRIAADPRYSITVFNLFNDPTAERLFTWIRDNNK